MLVWLRAFIQDVAFGLGMHTNKMGATAVSAL